MPDYLCFCSHNDRWKWRDCDDNTFKEKTIKPQICWKIDTKLNWICKKFNWSFTNLRYITLKSETLLRYMCHHLIFVRSTSSLVTGIMKSKLWKNLLCVSLLYLKEIITPCMHLLLDRLVHISAFCMWFLSQIENLPGKYSYKISE